MTSVNVFIPENGPADHRPHLEAFAQGVEALGDQVSLKYLEDGYRECDVAVVFGVPKFSVPVSFLRGQIIYEHRFRRRRPFLVMERGFIDRERYYGIAWNGLNGLGDFANQYAPSDRWAELNHEIKPWKEGGSYYLLCGQVPWDASVQHTDHVGWCQWAYKTVESLGLPVKFRPHPETVDYDYGLPTDKASWEDDLAGAKAVITFASTSSSLAVLDGIPVFTMDPGCMAWDVGNKRLTKEALESPDKPAREQWAYNLAYAQWTAEEMAQGLPWGRLRAKL
jgi:hypothetical protein